MVLFGLTVAFCGVIVLALDMFAVLSVLGMFTVLFAVLSTWEVSNWLNEDKLLTTGEG
jgi:hypothetical protein